jgi:isopentenyl-diphosphate delta-isomerase
LYKEGVNPRDAAEEIVLVDEDDRLVGFELKLRAHEAGGKLHRAFSVFISNPRGEMLLQLRSRKKYHFGGLWSNACCSHPRKGEGLEAAAHRGLKAEFGFDTDLKRAFHFIYKAEDVHSGLTEHELDHVFTGTHDGEPRPDPEEIDDWRWVSPTALREEIRAHPERFTPWFLIALERLGNWVVG